MAPKDSLDPRVDGSADDLTLTRRMALALLGVGSVGAGAAGTATADHSGAGNRPTRKWNQHIDAQEHDLRNLHSLDVGHLYTAAREAKTIVWQDADGTYHADDRTGTLYSGEEFAAAVQAAVDGLTDGRTTKERVVVACSGTMGPHEWDGDVLAIDVPSYTILDLHGTIRVEDEGEALIRPLRALNAEEIEIPRVRIIGNPRSAIWFRNVWNVRLGHVDVRMPEEGHIDGIGGGVRIDGFADGRGDDAVRCTDIQVDSAYFENTAGHAFETYSVERIQIGRVLVNGSGQAGVLLNDTHDATVDAVVGKDIDVGGGYAAFRLANACSDVTCGQVVARNCARGVFTVSDSSNATIDAVNIDGTTSHGILIQDGENVSINGGVVKNTDDEGVRIDSRSSDQHRPAEGISVSNLRIVDERDEPEMPYAINVTEGPRDGPDTSNVRLVDNDVRDAGTEGGIRVEPASALVRDNLGDGIDVGTVTLESGTDPAARVEGVTDDGEATLDLRAKAFDPPNTAFGWDHHFEYTGESWDLVVEWRTDPGEDLELDYVVDQPQAVVGRYPRPSDDDDDESDGEPDWDHDSSPGIVDNFEDGDLAEYEGETGAYEITDAAPVASGDYSLKSDDGGEIVSMDGLERYPAAGTTFSAKVGWTEENPSMGIAFGAQNPGEFYFVRVDRPNDDDARLQLWSPASQRFDANVGSLDPGVFYEVVVDWGDDGEFTVALNDPDGEEVERRTASDDAGYAGGGVGTRSTALLDEYRILQN